MKNIYEMLGIEPTDNLKIIREAVYPQKDIYINLKLQALKGYPLTKDKIDQIKQLEELLSEFDKVNSDDRAKIYYQDFQEQTLGTLQVYDLSDREKFEIPLIDVFISIPLTETELRQWLNLPADTKEIDYKSFERYFDVSKLAAHLPELRSRLHIGISYEEAEEVVNLHSHYYLTAIVRVKIPINYLQKRQSEKELLGPSVLNAKRGQFYTVDPQLKFPPESILYIAPMRHYNNSHKFIDNRESIWPTGYKLVFQDDRSNAAQLKFVTVGPAGPSEPQNLAKKFNIKNPDYKPLLISLIESKNWAEIKSLLDLDWEQFAANCFEQDNDGFSALHYLVLCQEQEALDLLAEILTKLKDNDKEKIFKLLTHQKYTPFQIAIINNRHLAMKILINHKANIHDCQPDTMKTPLYLACQYNAYEAANLLLEHSTKIHETDKYGRTPLHACASYEGVSGRIAQLLLDHGADPTIRDHTQKTPLDLARKNLMPEIIKVLDPSCVDAKNGQLLIDLILAKKWQEIMTLLDQADFDISKACVYADGSDKKATALHYLLGDPKCPSLRSDQKKTLDYLTSEDKAAILDILDKIFVRLSDTDKRLLLALEDVNRDTPLHYAASFNNAPALEKMLPFISQGIIEQRDKYGMTALHCACIEGGYATAELLLKNHANPNATNNQLWTPLHACARYTNDLALTQLLLRYNADKTKTCLHRGEKKTALQLALDFPDDDKKHINVAKALDYLPPALIIQGPRGIPAERPGARPGGIPLVDAPLPPVALDQPDAQSLFSRLAPRS